MIEEKVQKKKKIRWVIKFMAKEELSPFSILSSVNFILTPDESEYLLKYEERYLKQKGNHD